MSEFVEAFWEYCARSDFKADGGDPEFVEQVERALEVSW